MRFALFAALCLASIAGASTDFSAWKDSVRIYFNTTSTGAPITAAVKNFPLLVRLDTLNFNFSKAPNSPADIRFSDADGSMISSQVSRWDVDFYHQAEIWVTVPQVDANSSTDYVTMHWNHSGALSEFDNDVTGHQAFDTADGFSGAWHLEEAATQIGATGFFADASNGRNPGDNLTSTPSGAGAVGRGQQFDGADDYISIPNRDNLNFDGPMTISAWINGTSFLPTETNGAINRVNTIVRKGSASPNNYQLSVAGGHLYMALDVSDDAGVRGALAIEAKKWTYVAGVWDGKTVQLFVNGKLDIDKAPAKTPVLKKDTRPLCIGGRALVAGDANTVDIFSGGIDEVQVSHVVRSKDWLRLAYENQKPGSTMLTFKTMAATVPTVPTGKDDYSQWAHARKLSFDNSTNGAGVAGAVENFPVLVRLTSANFTFSQAQAGGADLRFSDPDGTSLPYAIERWDAALSKAEIWVRVPKVDGGSGAATPTGDYINMYWGKSDAPDAQQSAAVFDTANGFAGVWHLNQGAAGTGSKSVYRDASAAGNNGDDFAASDPSAALIGIGQTFGGSSDDVSIPSAPSLALTDGLSISAWINGSSFDTAASQVNTILRKGTGNPNNYQLSVGKNVVSLTLDGYDGILTSGKTKLAAGTWYHVAATWAKGRARIYVNGELDLDATGKPSTIGTDTRALYIGGRDADGTPGDQFKGMIDEVQLSRSERSADWMKLAYQNQRPDSKLIVFQDIIAPIDTTANPNPNPNPDTVAVVPIDTVKPQANAFILAPGENVIRKSLIKITNPSTAAGSVQVVFSTRTDLEGMGVSNAGEAIAVRPVSGTMMSPIILETNSGGTGNQSLFEILPGTAGQGVLRDMGLDVGSWILDSIGSYFLGRDTVTPVIHVTATGTKGDSSWIEFLPADNVENLIVSIALAGTLDQRIPLGVYRSNVKAGVSTRLSFKGPDDLSALGVSLRLADGSLESVFPSTGDFPLMRSFADVSAPISLKGNKAWALAGIPLLTDPSMRMRDLFSGGDVYGALWLNSGEGTGGTGRGEYRILQGDDSIPAGKGIWLGSKSPVTALHLGAVTTFRPETSGVYRVTLMKGWNQVTCPSLAPLPWPISHSDTVHEDMSSVKGLQCVNAVNSGYQDVDSLMPWKGYFVYSKTDTTVDLALPVSQPAAKSAAKISSKTSGKISSGESNSDKVPVQVLLELGGTGGFGPIGEGGGTLRLGAAIYAQDSVGIEDALMAPPPQGRGELSAVRSGRSLKSDLVGFREGGAYAWKLAWSTQEGNGAESGHARVRVAAIRLPKGLSLWAASRLRNVVEQVDTGSVLELNGDANDTLILWAGPMTGLAKSVIGGLRRTPSSRSASWVAGTGALRVALPAATGVTASFWDLSGTQLAEVKKPALAAGYYEFPVAGCRNYPRIMVVTVEFTGGEKPGRMVFKALAR